MTESTPSLPPPASTDPRGSLLQGFFIAWGAVIGASVVGPVLFGALAAGGGILAGIALILLVLAPFGLAIGLIVHFARKGQTQTAKGVALGLASIVALLVLLVSACFSLLNGTNFH